MARFLGVRVPSEPFSMTRDCVDWEKQVIRAPSPKTVKQGRPFRLVPLFPPLRPYLEALWEATSPGTLFIFDRLRQRSSLTSDRHSTWRAVNLRTQLERLIVRAGLRPWPKPWQNLRSSAEMDLLARFPPAAVFEWIGHTHDLARCGHWQVQLDFRDDSESLIPMIS